MSYSAYNKGGITQDQTDACCSAKMFLPRISDGWVRVKILVRGTIVLCVKVTSQAILIHINRMKWIRLWISISCSALLMAMEYVRGNKERQIQTLIAVSYPFSIDVSWVSPTELREGEKFFPYCWALTEAATSNIFNPDLPF